MLVFIRDRLLKRDYASGTLPRDPQIDEVKGAYAPVLADRLVTDDEWAQVCEAIYEMREGEEQARERPTINRLLEKYGRFPTIDKVCQTFGQDRADRYKSALEAIEVYGCSDFPDERYDSPWRTADLDVAVSIVTDVISPHMGDEVGMTLAFSRLAECARDGRRRKKKRPASCDDNKALARSLGIWLPVPGDIERWKTDARTRDAMPVFLPVLGEVVRCMKLARSYFQYIPRRRLCDKTVADFSANLERMKAYLRGIARAKKNNGLYH